LQHRNRGLQRAGLGADGKSSCQDHLRPLNATGPPSFGVCQCEHGEVTHDIHRDGSRSRCSLASCTCTGYDEAYRYTLEMVERRVQQMP
jgi:hypothetical protein